MTPQRGPQHQTLLRPRTVQSEPVTTGGTPAPACTLPPQPSTATAATAANHARTPARPQFHPGHRATKWPIFFFVRTSKAVVKLVRTVRRVQAAGGAAGTVMTDRRRAAARRA